MRLPSVLSLLLLPTFMVTSSYTAPGPNSAESNTGAITVAISATGNDTDSALPRVGGVVRILSGDWTAHPFLTCQAAINALPKIGRYYELVNAGSETFDGCEVSGFRDDVTTATTAFPLLKISGTIADATLTTGTATGTATSGSLSNSLITLTDSGQSWTASNLRGKLLVITSGTGSTQTTQGPGTNYAEYEIIDNTATAITFRSGLAGNFTPDTTTHYRVADIKTYFRKYLGAAGNTAALNVQNVDGIVIQNVKVGGNSATAGLSLTDVATSYAYGVLITDAMTTGVSVNGPGTRFALDALYTSGVTNPVATSRAMSVTLTDVVTDTGAGLSLADAFRTTLNGFDIRSSTSAGLSASRLHYFTVTNGVIQNSTGSAMSLTDSIEGAISIVSGTGNGSLGMDVVRTGFWTVTSPNSSGGVQVTGTSGDLRMDGNIQTWATLSSSGKLRNNDVVISSASNGVTTYVGTINIGSPQTPTAGTTQTQAGATALTGNWAVVTVGNSGDGVILPAESSGRVYPVCNSDASKTMKLYCTSPCKVNQAATGTGVSVSAATCVNCYSDGTNEWCTHI